MMPDIAPPQRVAVWPMCHRQQRRNRAGGSNFATDRHFTGGWSLSRGNGCRRCIEKKRSRAAH